MASRDEDYHSEPQEDDELTSDKFEENIKMNAKANGRTSDEKIKRNNFKYMNEKLWSNRHYQIHALSLIIILILGITLLTIGIKILILALNSKDVECETSLCLLSSSRISSKLNQSIDPCTNFYDFACKSWINTNKLLENQGFYTVKDEVQEKVYYDLRHFLDKVLVTAPQTDPHFKAKKFYQTCMNLEEIDFTSHKYFIYEIQNAGGWNIIGNWHGKSWDQASAVESLHVIYGVQPFFKIMVGADDLDPQLPYIIKIYPSGLGLPSRDYYFDPKYKKVADAYKQYMMETIKIFEGTKLDSSQFSENTFNYEKRLAEVTPDPNEYLKPANVFKRRFSIRELKILAPSIKWDNILQKYFHKARLNDNTRVLLAFDSYFQNVSNIISTTDTKGLNDYLNWKMISAYAPYLSKEFRIIHNNFNQALYGLQPSNSLDDENRWKFCIKTTSKFLGYSLASLYVNNKIALISNTTVKSKIDIVNSVRDTIIKNPKSFVWNKNDYGKKLIDMKMKTMQIFVGQPNFVIKQNLADYYKEYIVGIKFLQNIIEAISHRHKKMEMLLNHKSIDHAWPLLPFEVDLTYEYASNTLFIPAAILQDPFYNPNELHVLQFGSLGFHVASNLLKAFDLTGLYYGLPDGRLSTNTTFVKDRDLTNGLNCLQKNLQLREDNLSQTYIDLGALNAAWSAYKNFETHEKNVLLPTIHFSRDQLFFISLAQSMCANVRPETMSVLNKAQLPDFNRVNLMLSQSKTFSQAFNCPKPVESQTCNLWN